MQLGGDMAGSFMLNIYNLSHQFSHSHLQLGGLTKAYGPCFKTGLIRGVILLVPLKSLFFMKQHCDYRIRVNVGEPSNIHFQYV